MRGQGCRVAAMAAPSCPHYWLMARCFYGNLNFLCKHFQLQISSLQFPQTVSLPSAAVLSPGSLSNHHVPASSLHADRWTCVPGWDMQGCGANHLYGFHSVLPVSFSSHFILLQQPQMPSFCPNWYPVGEGVSLDLRTFLLLQLHPLGVQVPSCFRSSSFYLLSFIFPSWCLRSSASVLVLCVNHSICRCILGAFVERD